MALLSIINSRHRQDLTQYLLDIYPNAVRAYSLRKIKNGVTNVVKVRRSSDNMEQDFTPKQIVNGALTTFTGANDGFVSVWYDQSGNGVDSFNLIASEQPQIVLNGALILEGGKPSLLFDGGQQLDTGNVSISSSNYSFFGVSRYNTTLPNATFRARELGGYGAVEGAVFLEALFADTANFDFADSSGNSHSATNLDDLPYQVSFLASTHYTPNTALFYVDGSQLGTPSIKAGSLPIGTVTLPYLNIGGKRYSRALRGSIQECILYDNDKQSDRTNIETDINDYYTIF